MTWTKLDELRAIGVDAATTTLGYTAPESYIRVVHAAVDAVEASHGTFTPDQLRAAALAMEDVDPMLALDPTLPSEHSEYLAMLLAALRSLGLVPLDAGAET